MKIAVSIHSLRNLGGTETYVSTVADHLQRDGHQVWVMAKGRGKGSELAEHLGLRVVEDAHELPRNLDAAIPQDGPSALDVFAVLPDVPQIFVSHTSLFDVGMPPQVAGAVRAVVTLYKSAHDRMVAQSVEAPIEAMLQPVDTERFKSTTPLNQRPVRALAFGNYLHGERLETLKRGCELAGIELVLGGAAGGGELDLHPEVAFNSADIVFGKAKVIHEAMGCGRAVYIYDIFGAAGWVTEETYDELVIDNFSGRGRARSVTAESLAEDLAAYRPAMGQFNRDVIVNHHGATAHAGRLVELIRKYAGPLPVAADPGNAEELARLTRINWRHETDAFQVRKQIATCATELDKQNWQVRLLERELAEARIEIAALRTLVNNSLWRRISRRKL